MMNNKVWKIKGYEGSFTDEQIVYLIINKKISGEDALTCKEMKGYIKIKDSIYEYYLRKASNNENI